MATINVDTPTKHPPNNHKHHCHPPTPMVAPTNQPSHPTQHLHSRYIKLMVGDVEAALYRSSSKEVVHIA